MGRRKDTTVAPARTVSRPEPVALVPGMFAWVAMWTAIRSDDGYRVPTTVSEPSTRPGGTSRCFVLRTDDGWFIGGDLDEVDDQGGHPADELVAAEPVTPELLDVHHPTWREQFEAGWTPDPRPTTAADHLRVADLYANRVLRSITVHGYGNTSVDPALRISEYHQRQAQLRLDEIRRRPDHDPGRQREEAAMTYYLDQRPPGWPTSQG
jgi:hypothetical protein